MNPDLQQLVTSFERQSGFNNQLVDFIKKNGVPAWDKTLYTVNKNSSKGIAKSGIATAEASTKKTTTSAGTDTANSQGLFIVPLKSLSTGEVQSYITAYKHNDSLYTYRLYNKDSLNQIHPGTDSARHNLLTTQAVFGYFEKNINGKDSISVQSPSPGFIKNTAITFKTGTGDTSTNKSGNSAHVTYDETGGGCVLSIQMEISYTYTAVYVNNILVYAQETFSVSVTITLDCNGSGGGGLGDYSDPQSNPNYSVDPNTLFWYYFGSGWPYTNWQGSGDPSNSMFPHNWSTFWSSNGGYSLVSLGGNTNNDYVFTTEDMDILNQLQQQKDDEQTIESSSSACHGTLNIPGSTIFQQQATIAHLLIQEAYIKTHPWGVAEYAIPNSGTNGGVGRADLANTLSGELFEIKSTSPDQIDSGKAQIIRYATKANLYCPPSMGSTYTLWVPGTDYLPTTLPYPLDPNKSIKAELNSPGVITYSLVPRATNPIPSPIPQSVVDVINDLMKRRRANPSGSFPEIALLCLRQLKITNPALVADFKNSVSTIAAGIITAYIAQAILSEGATIIAEYELFEFAKDLIFISSKI